MCGTGGVRKRSSSGELSWRDKKALRSLPKGFRFLCEELFVGLLGLFCDFEVAE
jgi:hypothetical protein